MRQVRRHASVLISLGMSFGIAARAQEVPAAPVYVPSQSSVLNQNSVFLPTPPVATGQDVVRSAAGASCQSAVGSGGPYLDIGVIGSDDIHSRETAALYGRVVVPLGKRPSRVDCRRLYDLEIERLRMEVEVLRAGMMTTLPAPPPPAVAPAPLPSAPPPRPQGVPEPAASALPVVVGAAEPPPPSLKPRRPRGRDAALVLASLVPDIPPGQCTTRDRGLR